MKELIALAESCGFNHVGELNVAELEFMTEVREMCAADKCHAYGKSWRCPPALPSLEEMTNRVKKYHRGLLVQCSGELEDEFDIETMMELAEQHKQAFQNLTDTFVPLFPDCMPMGSGGGCDLCEECTYPDAPCRFPDKIYPSMEACGLFVSKVCKQSGMEYYYGPNTMTYTGCILLD